MKRHPSNRADSSPYPGFPGIIGTRIIPRQSLRGRPMPNRQPSFSGPSRTPSFDFPPVQAASTSLSRTGPMGRGLRTLPLPPLPKNSNYKGTNLAGGVIRQLFPPLNPPPTPLKLPRLRQEANQSREDRLEIRKFMENQNSSSNATNSLSRAFGGPSRTSLSDGDRSRLAPLMEKANSSRKQKGPPVSEHEQETADKLRLELHRSRLDNEASDRRISRLVRKVEDLEYSKSEAKQLKKDFEELEGQLHTALVENTQLKKKISADYPGANGGGSSASEAGGGGGIDKHERDGYVAKIRELTTKSETLAGNCKSLMKQLREYQSQIMDALGISDSDLCQSVANGGIGESSRTVQPHRLHAFLRSRVEGLKSGHGEMVRELASLRCASLQDALKSEGLQKQVQTLSNDKTRMLETFRGHESQIEYLSGEIHSLRGVLNEQLSQGTEDQLRAAREENEALKQDLVRIGDDWARKVDGLQRDVDFEQERYHAMEAQNSEERAEIEQRWQQLWESHSRRVKDEVDVLKLNYEAPLQQSQMREEALKKELTNLQHRYDRNKEAWEDYRLSLFSQMEQWKEQHIIKCKLLDELRADKAEFEATLEERRRELEQYENLVKDGVVERQDLQKNVAALQNKLRELLGVGEAEARDEEFKVNLGMLTTTRSWFSIQDFKKMKEKLQSKSLQRHDSSMDEEDDD